MAVTETTVMVIEPCHVCNGTGESSVPETPITGGARVTYSGGGPRSCDACEGSGGQMERYTLPGLAALLKPYL